MNVAPAPTRSGSDGQSACSNCGASLAGDQRYCLSCGQPVSPTRLAFRDGLAPEQARVPATGSGAGADRQPVRDESRPPGPLGRYAGLFGLLAVLLLAVVVGLLIGHWVTQTATPAKEVFTVEGAGIPAASGSAHSGPRTTAPSGGTPASHAATKGKGAAATHHAAAPHGTASHASKTPAKHTNSTANKANEANGASEQKQASEAQKASEDKKASEAKPTKLSHKTKENLAHSTGKKYEEEINKAVNSMQPIETG